MKKLAAAFIVVGLLVGASASVASAQPPNAVTGTAECEGFNDGAPFDIWIPNANAAFFNMKRQAFVGVTAIAIDTDLRGVGIAFADDNFPFPFRGKKPAEERGFTLTTCDVDVNLGEGLSFVNVGVKISPS